MAESHRRVEPRGIVGTGMANDPERLRNIEERAARMQRDYAMPKRSFGEVITGAPKDGDEIEWLNPPQEKERRAPKKGAAADKAEPAAAAEDKPAGTDAAAPEKAPPVEDKPKKPARPTVGAGNARVGSQLGRGTRVAFKV